MNDIDSPKLRGRRPHSLGAHVDLVMIFTFPSNAVMSPHSADLMGPQKPKVQGMPCMARETGGGGEGPGGTFPLRAPFRDGATVFRQWGQNFLFIFVRCVLADFQWGK